MIVPVNERDPCRRFPKRLGSRQPAKTSANNENTWRILDHTMLPRVRVRPMQRLIRPNIKRLTPRSPREQHLAWPLRPTAAKQVQSQTQPQFVASSRSSHSRMSPAVRPFLRPEAPTAPLRPLNPRLRALDFRGTYFRVAHKTPLNDMLYLCILHTRTLLPPGAPGFALWK